MKNIERAWSIVSKNKSGIAKAKYELMKEGYRVRLVDNLPSGNNVLIFAERSVKQQGKAK